MAKPAPSRSSALPALPSTSTFIHRRQSTTTTAPTLSSRPSIVKRAYRHNALAALEGRHKRSFWDTEEEEEDAEDAEMQFQHDSIASRLSMPITPDTIASSTVLETPIDYPLQEVSLNVHKPSVLSRPQPLFDISPLKISDHTTIAGSDSENWSFFSPTSDASSVPTEVTGYFVEFDFERKRKAAARVSESSVWATLIGAS